MQTSGSLFSSDLDPGDRKVQILVSGEVVTVLAVETCSPGDAVGQGAMLRRCGGLRKAVWGATGVKGVFAGVPLP